MSKTEADEVRRLRERVAELEGAMRMMLSAWRMGSLKDELAAEAVAEAALGNAALAPHPALPPSESGPAAREPDAEGATPSPRRTR